MALSIKQRTIVRKFMDFLGEIPKNLGFVKCWENCDPKKARNVYYNVYKHNGVYKFIFYCGDYGYDRFKSVTVAYNKKAKVRQYGEITLIMRADDDNSSPHPVLKAISWYEH